jgi:Ser/Thr protein kinase RdoA (MazF antagonist)
MSGETSSVPGDIALIGQPTFTAADVRRLVKKHWDRAVDPKPLASERDQNWALVEGGRPVAVLKIANSADSPQALDLQIDMMTRLSSAGLPVPGHVPTVHDHTKVDLHGYQAWMVRFCPGRPMADAPRHAVEVYADLGRVMGRAATALADFDHPGAHRALQWDLARADEVLLPSVDVVDGAARQQIIARCAGRFDTIVRPFLWTARRSVIHNDANNYNVLVEHGKISGLIDFGDAVHSATVNELAVACTYAMLDVDDPGSVARAVSSGFEEYRPLTTAERSVMNDLIRTRLSLSVCISANQQRLNPDNPYLSVSEQPAWRLLETMMEWQ